MSARATRVSRVNGSVRRNRGAGKTGLLPKFADESLKAFHLEIRRRLGLEVPHKANPDARHIQLFAREMSALNLFFPAVANVNLSVPHSPPIPYQEVIGHAIFHMPLFAMKSIDAPRRR
jgi:hypothetical protein